MCDSVIDTESSSGVVNMAGKLAWFGIALKTKAYESLLLRLINRRFVKQKKYYNPHRCEVRAG